MREILPAAIPRIFALSGVAGPLVDSMQVRQEARVSQAVLAALMNVAMSTVSQWVRGERRPPGAALKLLHVVKCCGIGVLR